MLKKMIIAVIGVAAVIIVAVTVLLCYKKSDTVKARKQVEQQLLEDHTSEPEGQMEAAQPAVEEMPDPQLQGTKKAPGTLYKDGEYGTDSAKNPSATQGEGPGEVKAQDAWKQAYIDLVNQYEAGQYDIEFNFEEGDEDFIEGCGYSLINLDNKGVPELVIQIWGDVWGWSTWIYTYDNDTLYEMAELYNGWHDHYSYISGEGIVVHNAVDGAGAYNSYEYYQIDSNNRLVFMYDETLRIEGETGDLHYYYGDTQITEEEYDSYYEERTYETALEGSSDSSEIINKINSR